MKIWNVYYRKHEKNKQNGLFLPLNIFVTLLAAKCKSKLKQCHLLIQHAKRTTEHNRAQC